jgi:cytochrome b561
MLVAAKATHFALYALLLLVPLSGWLMVTTTPVRVPTSVFGLFALPYPLLPDLAIYRFAHATHVALAILFAVLIAVHIVGATIHALLWRDQTLKRMWRQPTR